MNDTHGQQGEGWIGFDLDGTLAKYDGWRGIDHIGEPVKPMVDLIKRMHDEGKVVKIVTARVAPRLCGETHAQGCRCGRCEEEASKPPVMQEQYLVGLEKDGMTVKHRASDYIRTWCVDNLGFIPEIVYQKDHLMIELYDDRVKQVVPNEGWLIEDIAMSKRQVYVRREVEQMDIRWPSRILCIMLGAIAAALVIAVLDAALRPDRDAAERRLREALTEYIRSGEALP